MLKRQFIICGMVCLVALGACQEAAKDPGRVTLHRLNRVEYNNTVRDLLKTELRPADDFPSDDHGYGYDNIADVLAVSPLQVELYHRAAELLAEDLLRLPGALTFRAEDWDGAAGSRYRGASWSLWDAGRLAVKVPLAASGSYVLVLRAFGVPAGEESPQLRVELDGVTEATLTIDAVADAPSTYEVAFDGVEGEVQLALSLVNPYRGETPRELRRIVIQGTRVEGPLEGLVPSAAREQLVPCSMTSDAYEACARQILTRLATRAFRRPVTVGELARQLDMVEMAVNEGDSPERGLSLAIQAILLSPHFLYRVEVDPDPYRVTPHRLSDYELASRLSYFLWSTMPDEELLTLAEQGKVQTGKILRRQVTRMVSDERAQALTDNFAGQWLYSRGVLSAEPEPNLFPDFDDELAVDMKRESDLYFQEFLAGNLPVDELLSPGFTFLNERLASHYGISGVTGTEFRKVSTEGTARGGLLTQGAMHTVTSHQERTSIVLRGKWVLTQLLCDEPDPPPPGVESLEDQDQLTGSLRERLAQHRAHPMCASCHEVMDPIGFALENFDAIGQWREKDEGHVIDSSGVFPDGTSFDGAMELAGVVQSREGYHECIAEQLMIYGLGRGPMESDEHWNAEIVARAKKRGGGLQDLITEFVLSDVFRSRRGEFGSEGGE